MAQDDVVHQDTSRQPEEGPTPVVHHSTTPDRSSSDPRSAKETGDAVQRATPTEYADWLDGDFDLDVVPALERATFRRAFGTPAEQFPHPMTSTSRPRGILVDEC